MSNVSRAMFKSVGFTLLILPVLFESAGAQALGIEGFVPVETIVSDWDEKRVYPYRSGGVVDGYKSFECSGQEDIEYGISVKPSGGYEAVALPRSRSGERAPLVLPQTVQTALAELRSEGTVVRSSAFLTAPVDIEPWADGWVLAFARGEFGGGLLHISEQGETKVLDESNANDILRVGDLLYVGHGVDHLMTTPEKISIFGHAPNKLSPYQIQTPSAVYGLAEHNGSVVGRLSQGLFQIQGDGTVTYRINSWGSPYQSDDDRIGFIPFSMGILPTGELWLGGENILAVYDKLPAQGQPQVYIPELCQPDFGDGAPRPND